MSSEDKETIETAVDEAISWLEKNHDSADVDELKERKKQLEEIVQPIVSKLYQGAGGEAPPSEEDERDEL